MKKTFTAVAKVERNNKQWEVIIASHLKTKERAEELINEFIEKYKNTDLKVIDTCILSGELWKVFYHNEKELCSYTLYGTFDGEEQATKELLASEKGININDIVVKIETR